MKIGDGIRDRFGTRMFITEIGDNLVFGELAIWNSGRVTKSFGNTMFKKSEIVGDLGEHLGVGYHRYGERYWEK